MKNRNLAVFLNIVTFVITLIVNYLSVNLPLNNLTPQQISDSFDIYFVPAGYVFSIWGLIYLGLLAFLVFQALPAQRDDNNLKKIDKWFVISNLANALWLVSFHYLQFVLALFFMLVLLVSLIKIYLGLKIDRKAGSLFWVLAVEIPFSIYLGWITVATIANASQVLYFLKWDGFGIAPEIWFVIMVIAAVVISIFMSFTRRNIPYVLVLVWAFAGIAVKFPHIPLIYMTSWAGAAAAVIALALSFIIHPQKKISK
jgi:benzodiazapine receptor